MVQLTDQQFAALTANLETLSREIKDINRKLDNTAAQSANLTGWVSAGKFAKATGITRPASYVDKHETKAITGGKRKKDAPLYRETLSSNWQFNLDYYREHYS